MNPGRISYGFKHFKLGISCNFLIEGNFYWLKISILFESRYDFIHSFYPVTFVKLPKKVNIPLLVKPCFTMRIIRMLNFENFLLYVYNRVPQYCLRSFSPVQTLGVSNEITHLSLTFKFVPLARPEELPTNG